MSEGQRERRALFDHESVLYDEVRPGYPEALIADVIALSAIPPAGRILEIGCGTGKASLPFARRGYPMLCVELGANLAGIARRHLAPHAQVTVWTGAFEDLADEERSFDLVFAATAFHWLDPVVAYPKIARVLRPEGALALFWNLHVQDEQSHSVNQALQAVYRREAPELTTGAPRTWSGDLLAATEDQINGTGLFGTVAVRSYAWEATYTTREYLNLLRTHSDHLVLDGDRRERLLHGIAAVLDGEFGGSMRIPYVSTLYVAHRR